MMRIVDRIRIMEQKLDRALQTIAALDKALEDFEDVIPEIEELISYYESEQWHKDYIANLEGILPSDLKRGVLSKDSIYNLLTDYQRLKNSCNIKVSRDF